MLTFISYHNSKLQLAEHIANYLENHEIPCWLAPRNVPVGSVWDDEITKALKNSSALVLLFCEQADMSLHVKREIQLAEKYGATLYPLKVQNVEPEHLAYFLETSQWISWMDHRDETLDRLVRSIKSKGAIKTDTDKAIVPERDLSVIDTKNYLWPKLFVSCANVDLASELCARLTFAISSRGFDESIVLPTGRTARKLFYGMIKCAHEFPADPFNGCQIFTDTETFGVYSGHDTSRSKFVKIALLEKLENLGKVIPKDNVHLLSGIILEKDPFAEINNLLKLNPPLVHIVSISPVGEALGYEIGTYNNADYLANDRCHVIELSEIGRRYIDSSQPSRSVVTIGMNVPLSSRLLLLPILDVVKSQILRRLFLLGEDPSVPASLLTRNSNSIIVSTDEVCKRANIVPKISIGSKLDIMNFIDEVNI